MSKSLKTVLIVFASAIGAFVAFLLLWALVLFPNFIEKKGSSDEESSEGPTLAEVADLSPVIDRNDADGTVYVNNEIIVFIDPETSNAQRDQFFESLGAEVDDSMGDIGVYRLIFGNSMTHDDLQALIEELKTQPIVDDAYLNLVTEFENSANDEDQEGFSFAEPFYPNDPWNSGHQDGSAAEDGRADLEDLWGKVAQGENWGMEAIEAPYAWGYLDRLQEVNIGIIDSMPLTSHADLASSDYQSMCFFVDAETGDVSQDTQALDAENHGTHVSGIINAEADNGIGVAGVMGGKAHMRYCSVHYITDEGLASYATAFSYVTAIKTLVDQDVRVVNISQGYAGVLPYAASHGNADAINAIQQTSDLAEEGLKRIIETRREHDLSDFVICVAAGNDNDNYYYKDDNADFGYREKPTWWESLWSLFGLNRESGGSLALYSNYLNLIDDEEVRDRIIVVGAVGIDQDRSTSNETRFKYTDYSGVGDRVDIVAPGGINDESPIYSCVLDGYGPMCGTSMAAPHVAGVAGLVFGANPGLTGPEVKDILLNTTKGRYYYGDDFSGMVNANTAVVAGLQTQTQSVPKVLKIEGANSLDLCFVVDTTSSMGDDIENAQENMENILGHLSEKTDDYRVALVDYRDFADRTGDRDDYPSRVQLDFTDDVAAIIAAIDALDLGSGGDSRETVYSGLMSAVGLDWRDDAEKVIIVMGDAGPLDPEPTTEYTYEDVLLSIFSADIDIDYENSDERVADSLESSLIGVYSIGTTASDDAAEFFSELSDATGGSYVSVDDASEVADAINDSIEQIDIVKTFEAPLDFGEELGSQAVDIASEDGGYLFTIKTDEEGMFALKDIEGGSYRWMSNSVYGGGALTIDPENGSTALERDRSYWFAPFAAWLGENAPLVCLLLAGYIAICVALPLAMGKIAKNAAKAKATSGAYVFADADQAPNPQAQPSQRSEARARFCPRCGKPVEREGGFCVYCGKKLP